MRTLLYTLLLVPLAFAPAEAYAQFGPIVPEVCRACPCGFGGVLAIVQNVMNFIIAIGIIIATLIIVWGGILYVLSPANPENRSTANKMLINAVVGLLITLSAWLIVDFVMKTLYNPGATTPAGQRFGPWNSILLTGEGAACVEAREPKSLFSGSIFAVPGTNTGSGSGGGGSCTSIPDSQLATFPSEATQGEPEKALADTVRRFMEMRAAAARDGIDLKVSDGYRSPEEQLSAWNQNGCQLVNGRAQCRVRTAAVPCSLGGSGSNHTNGTAVDIHLGTGVYTWLRQNASRYGFYNNLPNDLPHWSSTGR